VSADEGRTEAAPTLLERAGSAAAGISSVGSHRPRLRTAIQWGLAGLIFASLIVFVIRQWDELPEDFAWHFEPAWLALSFVALAAFYAWQAEIWRHIVHSLGETIPPVPSRAVWGKSLIARYVPTNVLMVVGRVVMAERYGVAKRVSLASIVYELGLTVGTAVMVGAYFVIQLPELNDQPARFAVLLVVPIVLAVLHPRVFEPLADFALRKLGREPLPRTLRFREVLGYCLAYLAAWAMIGAGLCAFASALTSIAIGDAPYIAAAYPVAFCVAVVTFIVPSGLGTRDAALAVGMGAVLDETVAVAIAVAFRIFQTLIELAYVGTVVAIDKRVDAKTEAKAS
jgi:glycosyltransferase 2 family protein